MNNVSELSVVLAFDEILRGVCILNLGVLCNAAYFTWIATLIAKQQPQLFYICCV